MKEGISTRNARKAIEKLGKTKVAVQLDGANRITDQIKQPKKKSPIQPSKYELFNFGRGNYYNLDCIKRDLLKAEYERVMVEEEVIII